VYTTCEAGKRRTVNHTRALARLAGPGGARARARAHARPDVTCRCGAVRRGAARCDVMAILPLTAINRAIKRAIKSVINGHNRIT